MVRSRARAEARSSQSLAMSRNQGTAADRHGVEVVVDVMSSKYWSEEQTQLVGAPNNAHAAAGCWIGYTTRRCDVYRTRGRAKDVGVMDVRVRVRVRVACRITY